MVMTQAPSSFTASGLAETVEAKCFRSRSPSTTAEVRESRSTLTARPLWDASRMSLIFVRACEAE